jgi:DNA modification methylase
MTKPFKTITNKNFQLISPNKLTPYENNARQHSDDQIMRIAESMREFGQVTPILVNKNRRIIAGHARWEAAKLIGLQTVAIVRIDHLTDAQIRLYTIADNKLAELATWDEAILAGEFSFLMEAELNGEIENATTITGFTIGQIDFLTQNAGTLEDGQDDNVSSPDLTKPIVTKLGDLWLMDRHKAYCADSKVSENYKTLIGASKLSAVTMDGPYNIPIDGFVGGKGKVKRREFADGVGEMSSEEFIAFNRTIFENTLPFLKPGGLLYAFIDWRSLFEMLQAARQLGLFHVNTATWAKNVSGMGSFLRSQTEFCPIFRNGDAAHRNNVMLGKNGRNRSNLWEYPSANSSKEGRAQLQNHPTPKPVAMFMDILMDCTKPGDITCDPFLGSGTTLIAAEKTKRICYGLELDAAYMDCIVRRWQALTGKQAVHAETGLSFNDHEKGLHLVKQRGGRHVRER